MNRQQHTRGRSAWSLGLAGLVGMTLISCDSGHSGRLPAENDRVSSAAIEQDGDTEQNTTDVKDHNDAPGAKRNDPALAVHVKSALMADPELKEAVSVAVTSVGGIVALNGIADSVAARARAAQVASNVTGVVAVTNNLRVRGS